MLPLLDYPEHQGMTRLQSIKLNFYRWSERSPLCISLNYGLLSKKLLAWGPAKFVPFVVILIFISTTWCEMKKMKRLYIHRRSPVRLKWRATSLHKTMLLPLLQTRNQLNFPGLIKYLLNFVLSEVHGLLCTSKSRKPIEVCRYG